MTFLEAKEKIESFASLKKLWDSFKTDPPNESSRERAVEFLRMAGDFLPRRISPTSMGGVALTWSRGPKKVLAEFYNRGDQWCLFSDRAIEEMDVKKIVDFKESVKLFQDYLS